MKVSELSFEPHPIGMGCERAVVKFKNGFGASVVQGKLFYTSPDCPYEIAVLDKDENITYETPVTDDVCGYLTEEEANKILAQIEAL